MAHGSLGLAIAAFSAPAMTNDLIDASYHRKPVQVISIETNQSVNKGSSAPPGQEDCRQFKLTPALVRGFLRRAVAVQSLHDYQYGGCSADGQVTFADGSKATWSIMSSRIGYLTFADGRAYNLFCRYEVCRDKIYAFYDGVNSDSEDAASDPSPAVKSSSASASRGKRKE